MLAFHEMGVPQSLLDVLIPLSTFSIVQSVDRWPKCLHSAAEVF